MNQIAGISFVKNMKWIIFALGLLWALETHAGDIEFAEGLIQLGFYDWAEEIITKIKNDPSAPQQDRDYATLVCDSLIKSKQAAEPWIAPADAIKLYQQAETSLSKFLQQHPAHNKHSYVRTIYAQIYFDMGNLYLSYFADVERATKAFDKYLQIHKETIDNYDINPPESGSQGEGQAIEALCLYMQGLLKITEISRYTPALKTYITAKTEDLDKFINSIMTGWWAEFTYAIDTATIAGKIFRLLAEEEKDKVAAEKLWANVFDCLSHPMGLIKIPAVDNPAIAEVCTSGFKEYFEAKLAYAEFKKREISYFINLDKEIQDFLKAFPAPGEEIVKYNINSVKLQRAILYYQYLNKQKEAIEILKQLTEETGPIREKALDKMEEVGRVELPIEKLYQLAIDLAKDKQYLKAIRYLKSIIVRSPALEDKAKAWYMIAQNYTLEYRYFEALIAIENIFKDQKLLEIMEEEAVQLKYEILKQIWLITQDKTDQQSLEDFKQRYGIVELPDIMEKIEHLIDKRQFKEAIKELEQESEKFKDRIETLESLHSKKTYCQYLFLLDLKAKIEKPEPATDISSIKQKYAQELDKAIEMVNTHLDIIEKIKQKTVGVIPKSVLNNQAVSLFVKAFCLLEKGSPNEVLEITANVKDRPYSYTNILDLLGLRIKACLALENMQQAEETIENFHKVLGYIPFAKKKGYEIRLSSYHAMIGKKYQEIYKKVQDDPEKSTPMTLRAMIHFYEYLNALNFEVDYKELTIISTWLAGRLKEILSKQIETGKTFIPPEQEKQFYEKLYRMLQKCIEVGDKQNIFTGKKGSLEERHLVEHYARVCVLLELWDEAIKRLENAIDKASKEKIFPAKLVDTLGEAYYQKAIKTKGLSQIEMERYLVKAREQYLKIRQELLNIGLPKEHQDFFWEVVYKSLLCAYEISPDGCLEEIETLKLYLKEDFGGKLKKRIEELEKKARERSPRR